MKVVITALIFLCYGTIVAAEETFVTIHKVSGNRISVTKDSGGGRGIRDGASSSTGGPGRRGFGRGRRAGTDSPPTIVTVPANTKMTSAMRERRTFEFRVGAELAGGLRHRVFREMKTALSARVVTDEGRITEINVIIPETDINQSGTTSSGEAVVAVRPKRPPTKRP